MPVYDFPIHPLAKLFPEMSDDDFQKLKADIKKNGQLEPIAVTLDDVVLDGRHRMRACKELGINPRIRYFEEKIDEADFIWSKNLLRRHLTDDQRAVIAYEWADAVREAAKENQKRKSVLADSPKQKPEPIHTRKTIAKKAQVSEHKIRQVETVAKKKPELLPTVKSGATKLKDAAAQSKPAKTKKRKLPDKPEPAQIVTEKQALDIATGKAPASASNDDIDLDPWDDDEWARRLFSAIVSYTKTLDATRRPIVYARVADLLKDEAAFSNNAKSAGA